MEAGTAKASAASSSFAAKHISKQITEDIIPVTALKMEFMICSISGAEGSRPVCSAGTVSEAAETFLCTISVRPGFWRDLYFSIFALLF